MMSLREVVTQFKTRLVEGGLDFAAPDALLAWQIFKDFADLPIDCVEIRAGSLGVGLSHFADMDDELWLSFSRDIHIVADNGEVVSTSAVSCDLSHPVPVELASINQQIISSDFKNVQQFFAAVESWPPFQMCMQLRQWKWEETRWNWEDDEISEP